jgi:hypothetical protein
VFHLKGTLGHGDKFCQKKNNKKIYIRKQIRVCHLESTRSNQIKSLEKKSYQIVERMREVFVEIPKTGASKERRGQIALQVKEDLFYIGSS